MNDTGEVDYIVHATLGSQTWYWNFETNSLLGIICTCGWQLIFHFLCSKKTALAKRILSPRWVWIQFKFSWRSYLFF